ncbi:hypothetical protein NFI96_002102 [Prochilodus magdalenae]|nr:hypothetical protein NFI96_002102 [Prochilodus magdalenae]
MISGPVLLLKSALVYAWPAGFQASSNYLDLKPLYVIFTPHPHPHPSPSPPPSQSPPPSSAGGQSNTHGSHCPPTFMADQVRRQLRRLRPRKVAGPDKVVPATWKTTCLIPVPKKAHPKELNDYRPVALTSHVMKTMERLLLNHLRPQVHNAEDPLQFAYREKVGVEDAILYLLHRTHSHLDKGGGAVRVMFFDFSSAFNTIQPLLLRDKLMKMEVDMHLVTWITDYLTGRPQHVRIRDCTSDTVISSTGAPQGTVLSPVLFTLYTSDFKYNSELCHMQKFSDDTAVVGCVRNGQEREYRSLVEDFVEWCTTNHLKLNITKTKEMCIDFRRSRPSQQPISIKGVDVEVVRSYRYLGVHLDERLERPLLCCGVLGRQYQQEGCWMTRQAGQVDEGSLKPALKQAAALRSPPLWFQAISELEKELPRVAESSLAPCLESSQ